MNRLTDEHHAAQLQFVERVGLFFEGSGLPPMAGRILGWLLICDPAQQSSAELAEVLGASKGSISTNTRMLIQSGLIRRTAVRGRRGAYFEVEAEAWVEMLERKLAALTAFRSLCESGLALLGDASSERRERLEDITFVYGFFEAEWPSLMAKVREARAEDQQRRHAEQRITKEDACDD